MPIEQIGILSVIAAFLIYAVTPMTTDYGMALKPAKLDNLRSVGDRNSVKHLKSELNTLFL